MVDASTETASAPAAPPSACRALDVLVVAPRFPYPLDQGDRLTIYHLLRHFASRGHRLHLVTFVKGEDEVAQRGRIEPWCASLRLVPLRAWPRRVNLVLGPLRGQPFQVAYYRSPLMNQAIEEALQQEQPDIGYVHLLRMAEYLARRDGLPRIVGIQASPTLTTQRLVERAATLKDRLKWSLEHRLVRRLEPRLAAAYDRSLFISEHDLQAASRHGPIHNAVLHPHGVDVEHFAPRAAAARLPGRIVMTGNLGYAPNVDAAVWFATEVLPLVQREVPGAQFVLAGARPAPAVQALAERPGVVVTGWMEDLRDALAAAEVAVAPLRIASGLQNKVLEALAMGTPMVITNWANEGLRMPADIVCLADEPGAFAAAVIELLQDRGAAEAMAARAREYIVREWSWERHFADLEALMLELCEGQASGVR